MGDPWETHGRLMGDSWGTHGGPIGQIYGYTSGRPMGSRVTRGQPVGQLYIYMSMGLTYTADPRVGRLWVAHGPRKGVQCGPMDHPWVARLTVVICGRPIYRGTMGVPWVSTVNLSPMGHHWVVREWVSN